MQFKRDTDYALRIVFGLAESLDGDGEGKRGVSSSSIAAKAGIPKPSFERICGYLEENGIIRQEASGRGELRMYPGEHFWEQSILKVADAVEGGAQLFAVFDKRSRLYSQYGKQFERIQEDFEELLSHALIKSIFSRNND